MRDSKQIGFVYNAGLKWDPEYLNYDYMGIIINLFDDRAHATGNVNGSKLLMQKDVMNNLQETTIEDLFHEFIKAGYRIFITSDHARYGVSETDINLTMILSKLRQDVRYYIKIKFLQQTLQFKKK